MEKKISKSRGNGLSIDEWMTCGTKEKSLSLFICTKIQDEQRDCILIVFLKAWMNTKYFNVLKEKEIFEKSCMAYS